ncbi:MAG: hypothetical protein PVH25_14945, partial [Burkholderiales bacterium]
VTAAAAPRGNIGPDYGDFGFAVNDFEAAAFVIKAFTSSPLQSLVPGFGPCGRRGKALAP